MHTGTSPGPNGGAPAALPIDAHRDKILAHIAACRVTVIHGMTGCGKSSRLPAMILEDAEAAGAPVRIMVSQPRRIAATALKNRLSETLGRKVGLRLGNGVREEYPETRLWFVTTGYLARLLAHKMQAFETYTHLIVDEVHERSVDGDILCLLAKRVLECLPHVKLILMSATVHTTLYRDYFRVEEDTIFVGARRYPQQFYYAEDLGPLLGAGSSSSSSSSSSVAAALRRVVDNTAACRGAPGESVPDHIVKARARAPVSNPLPCPYPLRPGLCPCPCPCPCLCPGQDQIVVAAALARAVAAEHSSVLIFVSGMADITELVDTFEKNKGAGKKGAGAGAGAGGGLKLKCIAIHSDIPFEEQLLAFQPAGPGEAKVVIATSKSRHSTPLRPTHREAPCPVPPPLAHGLMRPHPADKVSPFTIPPRCQRCRRRQTPRSRR